MTANRPIEDPELRKLMQGLGEYGEAYLNGFCVAALLASREPGWWATFAARFLAAVEDSPYDKRLTRAAHGIVREFPWEV